MSKSLTKVEWQDVRAGLLLVPDKARGVAWKKLHDLVDKVLTAPAEIAKEFDPQSLRVGIGCKICGQDVLITQDHVVRVNEPVKQINHLDCWLPEKLEV